MAFNYRFLLVEVVVILLILSLIISLINKLLPKDKRILANTKSLVLSLLIVFGIIYGIGAVIESLEYYYPIVEYLNNYYLFFAIAITIYFPLYKAFFKVFNKSLPSKDFNLFKIHKKKFLIIVGVVWGIAAVFLSFDLLGLQLVWDVKYAKYDMLYIGFFTAFFTAFLIIVLTYLINKAKPIEKQIPNIELRNSLIASGIISFGIWSVQFIIFEMYLSRIFGLTIIKQDLRVIIVIILGIFIASYFNMLRTKFLPEAAIRSRKKIQEEIMKENNNSLQKESTVVAQDLDVSYNENENVVYLAESISNKIYLFILKKFRSLHFLDDHAYPIRKNEKIFKYIIVGLLWIVVLVIVFINLLQLLPSLSPVFDIFTLSVQFAFFMVLIDISINLIFNKLVPNENQISKKFLRDSSFFGGIILLWIWVVPLFFIYNYFFTGIYQTISSDFFSIIVFLFIIFLIGIYFTRWLSSKREFDTSLRKAVVINSLWLIINLPLKLLFVYNFGNNILNDLLILA
ncbi:MAG: hypothetical protein ACFE9R_04615, partial [Candidatus Hermodarchaeota archaeon]